MWRDFITALCLCPQVSSQTAEPVWNEAFSFLIKRPHAESLELQVALSRSPSPQNACPPCWGELPVSPATVGQSASSKSHKRYVYGLIHTTSGEKAKAILGAEHFILQEWIAVLQPKLTGWSYANKSLYSEP